jgi:CRP-like cAMP-binding protein
MANKNLFSSYINQQIKVLPEEFDFFFNLLSFKKYEKNDIILKQDTICKNQFFILKGILIASETDEKGIEHVIQIGTENSWIGDLESYINNTHCTRTIKAYCTCELLLLNQPHYQKLLSQYPVFEKLFRILFQTAYIKQTERVSMMLKTDVETRLKYFLERNKNLINKVEWKTIASYLDMSPETLSRIKKRLT